MQSMQLPRFNKYHVILVAVALLAIWFMMESQEGFNVEQVWPFLPPKHWQPRQRTNWYPWHYYRNGYHPAVPKVSYFASPGEYHPLRFTQVPVQPPHVVNSVGIAEPTPAAAATEAAATEAAAAEAVATAPSRRFGRKHVILGALVLALLMLMF